MQKFKKSVRQIELKSFSLSGRINSFKQNRSIDFESSLERDFIYLLEFDKSVSKFLEQPVRISYTKEDNFSSFYIPDFAVEYYEHLNKKTEIIEIKYKRSLTENRELVNKKSKAAKEFCEENGLIYRVLTEDYIRKERKIELDNFKFLSRYKYYFKNLKSPKSVIPQYTLDSMMLQDKIALVGRSTVLELVNSCTSLLDKKAELIFLTWCLISDNYIKIDFSKKININSEIWHS